MDLLLEKVQITISVSAEQNVRNCFIIMINVHNYFIKIKLTDNKSYSATDLDECSNGSHSCHPTALCVNTEGGFQCTCSHKPSTEDSTQEQEEECKLSM